jgi:hypothetical protein
MPHNLFGHSWSYAGGRSIERDGKAFAHVARSTDPKTENGASPADVDEFARLASAAPILFERMEGIEEALRLIEKATQDPGAALLRESVSSLLRDARALVSLSRG